MVRDDPAVHRAAARQLFHVPLDGATGRGTGRRRMLQPSATRAPACEETIFGDARPEVLVVPADDGRHDTRHYRFQTRAALPLSTSSRSSSVAPASALAASSCERGQLDT